MRIVWPSIFAVIVGLGLSCGDPKVPRTPPLTSLEESEIVCKRLTIEGLPCLVCTRFHTLSVTCDWTAETQPMEMDDE